MIPSTELFDLIKGLNKHEKIRFKVFCGKHNTEYLKLFECIARQERYDEEKIKKKLKSYAVVKHLPETKNYLYNLILESLEIQHARSNIDSSLYSIINRVAILFEKGLYSQCDKLLQKARTQAIEHEKHEVMMPIIFWEREMLYKKYASGKLHDFAKRVKTSVKEMELFIRKVENLNSYWGLQFKLFERIAQKYRPRTSTELKKREVLLQDPLLKNEDMAISHKAKVDFNIALSFYYYLTDDLENGYKSRKRSIELMENHPKYLTIYYARYHAQQANQIGSQIQLGKYDEALKNIEKLRALPVKREDEQIRTFLLSYSHELDICIRRGEFQKGVTRITQIEPLLKKYEGKMPKPLYVPFIFNVFYCYFGAGEYSKALKWSNTFTSRDTSADFYEDIQCVVRLISLIIHYELGNHELLEYAVKWTYRFLTRKNNLYTFERIVMEFIRRRLPKIVNNKQLIAELIKMETELEQIIKDPFEAKILEYFDFISWIRSKVENKTFSEIIKQKNRASGPTG